MIVHKYIKTIRRIQALVNGEFVHARAVLATHSPAVLMSDAMIAALQSQDITIQRFDHMIVGLNNASAFFKDTKFKHAFLGLQYFQLMAMERDLQNCIATIRDLTAGSAQDASALLFNRYDQIHHLISLLSRFFKRSRTQYLFVGASALNEEQVAGCFCIYTMHVERVVLDWFSSTMPFVTRSEFLKHYEYQRTITPNESIEFF